MGKLPLCEWEGPGGATLPGPFNPRRGHAASGMYSEKSKAKFLRNVSPITETGCHIYLCGVPTNHGGHVQVKFDGKRIMAHRMAWELVNGEIPKNMLVLHKCDVPSCVNVEHLFLGTVRDNMNDRGAKGRTARGDKVGTSKLSPSDVVTIKGRALRGESRRTIATDFGVSKTTIEKILDGKNWRHI